MPVTEVQKDPKNLTMTITAEFRAPVERVWQLWEDPRQLERWWGPPTFPATMTEFDLTPGGRVHFYMTGPEGEQPRGWWRIISVDAPHSLEFEDGFADENWNPVDEMPTMTVRVDLTEQADHTTKQTIETVFRSTEAMEQILAMGAEEGMVQAINQIDELIESETKIG